MVSRWTQFNPGTTNSLFGQWGVVVGGVPLGVVWGSDTSRLSDHSSEDCDTLTGRLPKLAQAILKLYNTFLVGPEVTGETSTAGWLSPILSNLQSRRFN